MGFAGNSEPQFIIPSAIGTKGGKTKDINVKQEGISDLDFWIGDEAIERETGGYQITYPVKHGQIEDWTHMEWFWEHCIFRYLRCEPEDHFFLLVKKISTIKISFQQSILIFFLHLKD